MTPTGRLEAGALEGLLGDDGAGREKGDDRQDVNDAPSHDCLSG